MPDASAPRPATTAVPETSARRVGDLVDAVDAVTGGRLLHDVGDRNPWVVTKSSGIPGKQVTELPGLVHGDRRAPLRRAAIAMTLSEHDIELAGAMGLDALVVHHPVADAASSGGVHLATYLDLYGLAVIECHEALHGLHPGIAHLHGHDPYHIDEAFGGELGMVLMVGRPRPGVRTVGDVLDGLDRFMERPLDLLVNGDEAQRRGLCEVADSLTATQPRILHGAADRPLGEAVLHAFPHTGFTGARLSEALAEHPDVGTLILSISSVLPDADLVAAAAEHDLNLIVGNAHPTEILENGVPLGIALQELLPSVEFFVFRERVVALPLASSVTGALAEYGHGIASGYLLPRARAYLAEHPPGFDRATAPGTDRAT